MVSGGADTRRDALLEVNDYLLRLLDDEVLVGRLSEQHQDPVLMALLGADLVEVTRIDTDGVEPTVQIRLTPRSRALLQGLVERSSDAVV